MNKRISSIEISLNKIKVIRLEDATQGDKNTHFFDLTFADDVELTGYELQVYYLPPFPATVPLVDTFKDLQKSMQIVIPPNALERNGEVRAEFALSKDDELITINRSLRFEVRKTANGSSINAYVEGNFKETIADQIKKIELLFSKSKDEIIKTSKENIDNYIDKTSKPDLDAYLIQIKTILDQYVDENSKISIDEYVASKEEDLTGATYTPEVLPTGELRWTNNKNLPNPEPVNLRGKTPEFIIRDNHLFLIIKD